MHILLRCILGVLLLMLISIPAISEGISLGIESRFNYMLLFF